MGQTRPGLGHPRAEPGSAERRRFLRCALSGAAALALGSCVGSGRRAGAEGGQGMDALPHRHRLPERRSHPSRSRVALVRVSDHPSQREALRSAIALAGGLAFLEPGQSVLLKPAVNSGNRYPATTDPETVLTVAEMVKEAGGVPFVADRTMFLLSTEKVFRETAIRDAAEQAGIPCRYLEDCDSVPIAHPLAEHWRGNAIRIYQPVVEADHIINLCTPRTHKLGDFTMAMKNNVGVVNGISRLPMHLPWGLKERLAEINLVVRPSLIVMDGREGFADGGPDSGDLVKPGFVAAGSDPVAIDAVGLAHLRLEGANPAIGERSIWEIPTMKRAVEIGLGVANGAAIELVGADPARRAALAQQLG